MVKSVSKCSLFTDVLQCRTFSIDLTLDWTRQRENDTKNCHQNVHKMVSNILSQCRWCASSGKFYVGTIEMAAQENSH